MKKYTFDKFCTIMEQHNIDGNPLVGYIVFANESFTKEYSLESRTYKTASGCKYFDSTKIGNSLYGSSLDGSDICVRLDWYLLNEKPWVVDYCYFDE